MKHNSIFGGALLLTAAALLMRLVSIAFNVFLAERIGADGLGLLQLISTVGVFAALVGASGVRVATLCLCAEEFGKRCLSGVRCALSACLRYGFAVSAVTGLLLFFTAKPIAVLLLRDGNATLSLAVMGLLLPFSCLCGVMDAYYTACGKLGRLVAIQSFQRLFSLLLTALLLVFWARQDRSRACCAIISGGSLGSIFEFFLLYALYRKDIGKTPLPKDPPKMKGRLLRLCIPVALNDYLRAGLNTAEQLLIPYGLSQYAGSTVKAMADYGIVHAMVFPVLMFPAAILYSLSDLLVPELSRSRVMERQLRICDLTDKCLRLTFLFAGCVSGFLFCCARPLGQLLYSSADAGTYLRLFAPMVLMLYLDAITDGMLKGMAEQVSCVRYNTFTSLLDVVFLFLLLPRWGMGGYVFSFAVTHAINLFLSLRRLLQVTKHKMALSSFFAPLACLFPALAAASLLPQGGTASAELLRRGGIFLLLYLPLCLLSNALSQKDLTWLRRIFSHTQTSQNNSKMLP